MIFVVLCDKQWGMVKMTQQFALEAAQDPGDEVARAGRDDQRRPRRDRFDRLAESMGAHGERVSDPAELQTGARAGLAAGGPAVIHVDVDPVKHMWAPGLHALQGHAPGTEGKSWNAIDAVRLNFSRSR